MNQKQVNNIIDKVLLNRYKIKNLWKKGGQSFLFDAIDLENKQNKIIVKLVETQEFIKKNNKQYLDEFNILKNLNDERIIKLYDYTMFNNYFAMIIEKCEYPNLRDYINHNEITLDNAIKIMLNIIQALKLLHFNNYGKIIHRDIKPENILIDKNLNIKIIDFGISTQYNDQEIFTHEQDLDLSVNYASSDVLMLTSDIRKLDTKEKHRKFKKIVSYQLDIHSLGIIFYELLVKNLPFKIFKRRFKKPDKNLAKQKIISWKKYDIPKISFFNKSIPIQIDNIIHRCTASKDKYLCDRYKDIYELESDLKNYMKLDNKPLWDNIDLETSNYNFTQINYTIKKRFIILLVLFVILLFTFSIIIWYFIH